MEWLINNIHKLTTLNKQVHKSFSAADSPQNGHTVSSLYCYR